MDLERMKNCWIQTGSTGKFMSLRRRAAVILMKRQVNKMAGTMRKTPRGAKGKVENPGKLFVRLMKYVFKDYLWQCIWFLS